MTQVNRDAHAHCSRTRSSRAILAFAAPAHAQDWPQRPVTILVPFAAGGSADLLARILQQHMQAKFGVPFVVENRSGAGGSIGTGLWRRRRPDGYTLLVARSARYAINSFLYTKLNFDVARDLQPVSLCEVSQSSVRQYEDVRQVGAGADRLSEGQRWQDELRLVGQRHVVPFSAVMFALAIITKMTHVPFRSTAEVVNSMLGGNIDLAVDSMTTVWPLRRRIRRALAVTTPDAARRPPTCRPSARRSRATRQPRGKACLRRPAHRDRSREDCRGSKSASGLCPRSSPRLKTSARNRRLVPRGIRRLHSGRARALGRGRQGFRREDRLIEPNLLSTSCGFALAAGLPVIANPSNYREHMH